MCRMGFITGGPNEAVVVSGVFHSQPLIVVGGWAFVIPCIQKVQRLPLNIMTLKVSSPKVYTMQGVPLSVTGIAQVCLLSPLGIALLDFCQGNRGKHKNFKEIHILF